MEYLSNHHFIHRDLAARNCMLDNNLSVKVSDFGLSKHLITKDYYKTDNAKQLLPIKWMAIESLENGIYNTKTDVWSYAVLLWELMTRGVTPYPKLLSCELTHFIKQGYRLPRPKFCPQPIYKILLKCWQVNPDERPTFARIISSLEYIIQKLEQQAQGRNVKIEDIIYYNWPVTYDKN